MELGITENINYFVFNRIGSKSVYADFDDVNLVEPLADGSNNIPLNKTLTLTNLTKDFLVWANPRGMMHSAGKDRMKLKVLDVYLK